jgi:ribose 5-phosphate isomerase B
MRIVIGADHAGYELKAKLVEQLRGEGHEVRDVGTLGGESVDYPDFAAQVAAGVARGEAERGILVCSSGVGMSIAANKVNGVRAALGMNEDEVGYSRRHNDANVLAIGAKYTDEETACRMTEVFLSTEFEGGRHARRIAKIEALERAQKGS